LVVYGVARRARTRVHAPPMRAHPQCVSGPLAVPPRAQVLLRVQRRLLRIWCACMVVVRRGRSRSLCVCVCVLGGGGVQSAEQ
jgi:hypothetical protein